MYTLYVYTLSMSYAFFNQMFKLPSGYLGYTFCCGILTSNSDL